MQRIRTASTPIHVSWVTQSEEVKLLSQDVQLTNHAKHCGEDVVEENVGIAGDGSCAATEGLSSSRTGTGRICDESRRSRVEVTAAVKLHKSADITRVILEEAY